MLAQLAQRSLEAQWDPGCGNHPSSPCPAGPAPKSLPCTMEVTFHPVRKKTVAQAGQAVKSTNMYPKIKFSVGSHTGVPRP